MKVQQLDEDEKESVICDRITTRPSQGQKKMTENSNRIISNSTLDPIIDRKLAGNRTDVVAADRTTRKSNQMK